MGEKLSATKLEPKKEKEFQDWYKKVSTLLKINENPDDPLHFYDYRGAYLGGINPEKEGTHFPDTWKMPGHPTFSIESQYYKPGMKAGRWEGENYIPMSEEDAAKAYQNLIIQQQMQDGNEAIIRMLIKGIIQ